MSAFGLALVGTGMFLMYEAYKGFHTHTTATPIKRAQQAATKG